MSEPFPSITLPSWGTSERTRHRRTMVEADSGKRWARRSFTTAVKEYVLVWNRLSDTEYETLRDFVMDYPCEEWSMSAPVSGGSVTVRMLPGSLSAAAIPGGWRVRLVVQESTGESALSSGLYVPPDARTEYPDDEGLEYACLAGIYERQLAARIDPDYNAWDAGDPTNTANLIGTGYTYTINQLIAYINAIAPDFVEAGYEGGTGGTPLLTPTALTGTYADGCTTHAEIYAKLQGMQETYVEPGESWFNFGLAEFSAIWSAAAYPAEATAAAALTAVETDAEAPTDWHLYIYDVEEDDNAHIFSLWCLWDPSASNYVGGIHASYGLISYSNICSTLPVSMRFFGVPRAINGRYPTNEPTPGTYDWTTYDDAGDYHKTFSAQGQEDLTENQYCLLRTTPMAFMPNVNEEYYFQIFDNIAPEISPTADKESVGFGVFDGEFFGLLRWGFALQ